jgi:hypothetical protein
MNRSSSTLTRWIVELICLAERSSVCRISRTCVHKAIHGRFVPHHVLRWNLLSSSLREFVIAATVLATKTCGLNSRSSCENVVKWNKQQYNLWLTYQLILYIGTHIPTYSLIGCTSVVTNFLVYLFIQRFSQHVSVVYDHHQAALTCTHILTPIFLLFLPILANVYIWR